VEYGVDVGTQGARLETMTFVEADLKRTERAAFCQGFGLDDGDPQTLCDSRSFC
jgi:hypothetical protein